MQKKRERVQLFIESFLKKYPLQSIKDLQYQLGVDQAGRGPVFGSMMYAALWWPVEFKQELADFGFDDSKALTEQKREELLQMLDMMKGTIIHYQIREITATQISTNMNNQKYNINLNQMSHNAALQLIKRAFQQGFKITHIYCDTVGDPGKYNVFLGTNLKQYSSIYKQIKVQPKADRDFKVVSAASICAKVNRDKILNNWKFVQGIEFKGELGSGYPGDPKTKDWLVKNKHPIFGYPNIVRFSWSTAANNLQNYQKMHVLKAQQDQTDLKGMNYILKNRNAMRQDLFSIVKN